MIKTLTGTVWVCFKLTSFNLALNLLSRLFYMDQGSSGKINDF